MKHKWLEVTKDTLQLAFWLLFIVVMLVGGIAWTVLQYRECMLIFDSAFYCLQHIK